MYALGSTERFACIGSDVPQTALSKPFPSAKLADVSLNYIPFKGPSSRRLQLKYCCNII